MTLELTDKEGLTDDSIESISTILERNENSLITSLTEIEDDLSSVQFNPKRERLVQQYFGFTIPMITELILNFKDNNNLGSLAFHRLVAMCPPKIESLELEYVKLVYNREKEPQLESLKKLRLSNVDLPGDSCIYLAKAFRNVKTLILEKCRYTDNSLVMIALDLLNLEVINDSLYPGNYLKATTISNLETQYYSTSHPKSSHEPLRKCSIPSSIPLYPPTKTKSSVPQGVCFLNFMCASVRNVVVFP